MKKIFLIIVTVSVIASANAQIKKGSIFLGGDISGSTQKTKRINDAASYKQSGINISPVFGKAIKDNLILGANAGLGLYKNDNWNGSGNNKVKSTAYNAGIFLRKYKNIGTGGFYLFVQGGLNGSFYKQEQEEPASSWTETKRFSVGINAYPGISYAVTNKLHLETGFNNLLSLSYFNEKNESGNPVTTTYKTNGFSIASSLSNATSSLYLGFRLLIGK
jgi:hypothetical protein